MVRYITGIEAGASTVESVSKLVSMVQPKFTLVVSDIWREACSDDSIGTPLFVQTVQKKCLLYAGNHTVIRAIVRAV